MVALGVGEFEVVVDPSELFGEGGGSGVLLCYHPPATAFEFINGVPHDFAERNQAEKLCGLYRSNLDGVEFDRVRLRTNRSHPSQLLLAQDAIRNMVVCDITSCCDFPAITNASNHLFTSLQSTVKVQRCSAKTHFKAACINYRLHPNSLENPSFPAFVFRRINVEFRVTHYPARVVALKGHSLVIADQNRFCRCPFDSQIQRSLGGGDSL